MEKRIIEFYERVVSCPNTNEQCPGIINCIDEDFPPRGFLSVGTPNKIDIVIVGKNPGHPVENEIGAYSGKSPRQIVKSIFNTSKWTIPDEGADKRSYTFHKNLLRYLSFFLNIQENEVFERCVYTNLVKCSTIDERDKLPQQTINECFTNYLQAEIALWNPILLLVLGREVERFLNRSQIKAQHRKPVIYVKHPSYYYRRDLEEEILGTIKSEINRHLTQGYSS